MWTTEGDIALLEAWTTSLSSLGVQEEGEWELSGLDLTPGAVGKVTSWEVCVLPAPSRATVLEIHVVSYQSTSLRPVRARLV